MSTRKSSHVNMFSMNPGIGVARSSFQRNSPYKHTFNLGQLVPFLVDEVLPGDSWNVSTTGLIRMATPIFPVMDNLFVDTHYFFVANRNVWDNWDKFLGAQENPGDSTDYLIPTMAPLGAIGVGGLLDAMGLPTGIAGFSDINALPVRCYRQIWNEWFRDQDLQDSLDVPTDDGPDPADHALFMTQRNKRHDYFTSAAPTPQKGPEVSMPLGDTATIFSPDISRGFNLTTADSTAAGPLKAVLNNAEWGGGSVPNQELRFAARTSADVNTGNMAVDLANATSSTVNQWREAITVQRFYEKQMRGGTREVEIIHNHFGVRIPDLRAHRPEYLGGGTSPVNVYPLYSTAESGEAGSERPLGALSAVATSTIKGHGFTKSFVEHGYIIGLISARIDQTYQQGIRKMWTRRDAFDFYWPSFQGLGEQPIRNKEIYADGTTADEGIFGYIPRYDEYRHGHAIITGQFRSQYAETLDAWHYGQYFQSLPTLGDTFIREDETPVQRTLAVQDGPQFIADFMHSIRTARPMPMFGVPGLSRL